MLWMAISYSMMLLSALGLGIGGVSLLSRLCGTKKENINPAYYLLIGFALLTFYAQVVSLFTAVTYIFAFLALGISLICMMIFRKELIGAVKACFAEVKWYEWILFLVFTIFIMFLTSLYPKQYDNYLYQAQLLRYYEEYGVVKGMGNISTRLGFNNSIYAFMALYSLKGIYGYSLHTVNSALCLFFGIFSIHGLCRIDRTKAYVSTGLQGVLLAYVFFNAETLNCIGTDLPAGLFGLMILILFARCIEQKEEDTFSYALLAIMIVYVVTVKVSMGMLGILVFYPAYHMIRRKEWRRIAACIPVGLLLLLPWLIRNVLISGWLIYPLPSLDLFDVKWKIPYESVVYESALVRGWARIRTSKVFDTLEMSLKEWFPVWFRALPLRYRLLLYLNIAVVIYEILQGIYACAKKEKALLSFTLIKLTVFAGILYWLFSAPDVRFGWIYIMAFPTICFFSSAVWRNIEKIPIHKIGMDGVLFECMMLFVMGYFFIKSDCPEVFKTSVVGRINLQAFYIYQGDFSMLPVEEYKIGEDIFYYSPVGDQAGYYGFPGTTDKPLLENLGYLGERFQDGVYHKGGESW
ncbi:MAG: hypothetical protein J1E61_09520 [Lachnospiraceae bacterium]|nr:hypothetical protein [Lachnospiraceae bacterium]